MIGTCLSTPEKMNSGEVKIKEEWYWLPGDMSSGHSKKLEREY